MDRVLTKPRELVADETTPYFTTSHFDGHLSVLVRASRLGELTRDELAAPIVALRDAPLIAFKRAGADGVLTYFAPMAAEKIKKG